MSAVAQLTPNPTAVNTVVALIQTDEKVFVGMKASDGKLCKFGKLSDLNTWLKSHEQLTVVTFKGGPAQSLFVGLASRGVDVYRVPFHICTGLTGLGAKANAQTRLEHLLTAFVAENNAFTQLSQRDSELDVVRKLARLRKNLQTYRIRAGNQVGAELREMKYLLLDREDIDELSESELKKLLTEAAKLDPAEVLEQKIRELVADVSDVDYEETETAQARFAQLLEDHKAALALPKSKLNTRLGKTSKFFADPGLVNGSLRDERMLEMQIATLLKDLPIYKALRQPPEEMPVVKGFGPGLGGMILGEIGSPDKFATGAKLRAYARLHVNSEGGFPTRQKGSVANWNSYLHWALWFWSTDQIHRYDQVWRTLYKMRLRLELTKHPEVVEVQAKNKLGKEYTRYDYTLKHCCDRASRWVASQLLQYIYELWSAIDEGTSPEVWYWSSRWPAWFAKMEGLFTPEWEAELVELRNARRRVQPEEVEEDNEEVEPQ